MLSGILKNATFRRALVAVLTGALLAVNKKLGLNLGVEEIAGITTLATAYIVQSALKSKAEVEAAAAQAGAEAAEAVKTPQDAAAVLNALPGAKPEAKP